MVLLGVLALVGERDDESEGEDADVHPEEATHIERVLALRVDKLLLAWVVAGEEECPRAHEQVRTDKGSRDHDHRQAKVDSEHAANDGTNDGNNPVAPDCVPLAASHARDQGEDERSTEEASDETEQTEHKLEVASDYAADNDTDGEGATEHSDLGSRGREPASRVADEVDEGGDKEANERCCDVREPFGAEEGDQGSNNYVDDANAPWVLFEPTLSCIDRLLTFLVKSIDGRRTTILHLINEIFLSLIGGFRNFAIISNRCWFCLLFGEDYWVSRQVSAENGKRHQSRKEQ